MTSTTLRTAVSAICFFCLTTAYAQDKLFFFGGSKTFRPDSIGHTFSFSFNRTETVDAEAGPLLKAWKLSKGGLFLKPSAAADIGSLTEAAEDNLQVDISLSYHQSLHNGWLFIAEFAPNYNTDKNFETGLLFAELTPKLAYRYFDESKVEHLVIGKVAFDYGRRYSKDQSGDNFARLIPDLSYKLAFSPKANSKPDGSQFQFFRFTINLEANAFIVSGDNTVVEYGTYGHFSASFDYRIINNVGLSIKYAKGYVQPKFKQVNAFSFGFSVFP